MNEISEKSFRDDIDKIVKIAEGDILTRNSIIDQIKKFIGFQTKLGKLDLTKETLLPKLQQVDDLRELISELEDLKENLNLYSENDAEKEIKRLINEYSKKQ